MSEVVKELLKLSEGADEEVEAMVDDSVSDDLENCGRMFWIGTLLEPVAQREMCCWKDFFVERCEFLCLDVFIELWVEDGKIAVDVLDEIEDVSL